MSCPDCEPARDVALPFCNACGARLAPVTRRLSALRAPIEPVLSVHPHSSVALDLTSGAPIYLFGVLWGTTFFGGVLHVILTSRGDEHSTPGLFLAIFLALLIVVPAAGVALTRWQRDPVLVFPHRLDVPGAWLMKDRSVYFDHIAEVHAEATAAQRRHEVATILVTPSEQNGAPDVIRIHDVPDHEEVARYLRLLAGKAPDADAPPAGDGRPERAA